MYKLEFSKQKSLLPKSSQPKVAGIYPIRLNDSNQIELCIRQGQSLFGLKLETERNESWINDWKETVFKVKSDYELNKYPLLVADQLLPNSNVIILRHPEGIHFYQLNSSKTGLELLKEDLNFHEVYDYQILMGRFYTKTDWVGLMTRSTEGEIKFYAATKDSFMPDEPDAFFSLNRNFTLGSEWSSSQTEFFSTQLTQQKLDVIGLRTHTGLSFYQFDSKLNIAKIANTSRILLPKEEAQDRLFFPNLTNQVYKDILHLNNSGLYMYQYQSTKQDYILLSHNTEFSRSNGWKSHHTDSVHLLDINNDSRDDLIFTGVHGITFLTFDQATLSWNSLLNTNELNSMQRYAIVVGALPSKPPAIMQSSIFVQDSQGDLKWARLVKSIDIPATTTQEKKTFSVTNAPTSISGGKEVPEQIIRQLLADSKPILRLVEQWPNNLLKDAVDLASGQVQFSLPLFNIQIGWLDLSWELSLEYSSKVKSSDLLGTGWSVSLGQDFIFVDFKGSVFEEHADYYLVNQGQSLLMELTSRSGELYYFKLANQETASKLSIEYNESSQRWTVEHETERAIYGRAHEKTSAFDSLQWGFGWPNWRGLANDKKTLEPLVTAWYLSTRQSKSNPEKVMLYYYDQDMAEIGVEDKNKKYTSGIRLKSVRDKGKETIIDFDYELKRDAEYTLPSREDHQGNIVISLPLEQRHFLSGYNLTTSAYTQSIKFVYETQNEHRSLSGIEQQLIGHKESALKFNYKLILNNPVLSECVFGSGLAVNFEYEAFMPSILSLTENVLFKHDVIGEKTKLAYGTDYAAIAYHDNLHRIFLRVTNRQLTETKIEWSFYSTSFIKSLALHAQDTYFILLVYADQQTSIYSFDRDEKTSKWSNSIEYKFVKNALISYSKKLIAVVEPQPANNFIMIYERDNEKKSKDWILTQLSISQAPVSLVVNQDMIFVYDSQHIWLLYCTKTNTNKSKDSKWEKTKLDENVGDTTAQTLRLFYLSSEAYEQNVNFFNEIRLQIINNHIAFSSLCVRDSQLYLNLRVYLLNARKEIAHKQLFEIKRENILSLGKDHNHESNTFHLGYVYENGYYRLRVKSISGAIISEVENNIEDENERRKEKDAIKKEINEKWENDLKGSILINFELYLTQLSPNGVYCGKDIFVRLTGAGWQRESYNNNEEQSIDIGQHLSMSLEMTDNNGKYLIKLYNNKQKEKKIKELTALAGRFLNRFPAYLAYQSNENRVNLLTFKDEKTLDDEAYVFENETLLSESDWQNFLTVVNSTASSTGQTLLVRSFSFTQSKTEFFVRRLNLTNAGHEERADDRQERLTGYEHTFVSDQQKLHYSKTVKITRGMEKSKYGWYEERDFYDLRAGNRTTTKHWFDADGKTVQPINKNKQNENTSNNDNESPKADSLSKLWDSSGQLLISDFTPFSLDDEMWAYTGFESYELNQMSNGTNMIEEKNKNKMWNFSPLNIVKGGFAFTGENYLKLVKNSSKDNFLEGTFEPRDQEIIYLVSCWLRSSHSGKSLALNKTVPHLKASLSRTSGPAESIELLAQVKRKIGDWFYLELSIDFQVAKKNLKSRDDEVNYKVRIRVEPVAREEVVDLDHIRFSPFNHEFEAIIYNPVNGQQIAVINENGLVERSLFNRLNREMASINENGRIKLFNSASRTGRLTTRPQTTESLANNIIPSELKFEPETGFYETFDSYSIQNNWKLDSPTHWRIAPGQLWHESSTTAHRILAEPSFLNEAARTAFRFYFSFHSTSQPSHLSINWHKTYTFRIDYNNITTTLMLPNGRLISSLPFKGELIIMLEKNKAAWLWLDGVLLFDQLLPSSTLNDSSFEIEGKGKVLIEDCLIMNNPLLRIEYFNRFGETVQTIRLENAETAQLTEILYDELGRGAIKTKTSRIKRATSNQPLLAYRSGFVTNKNPSRAQSVWRTGRLEGEVNDLNPLDKGVAYSRTQYAPNPLDEEQVLGLPGQEFSINGAFATKFGRDAGIALLNILFPPNLGYRHSAKSLSNGSRTINIYDKQNNEIAIFTRVPGYNHLLSTYEYDKENRLIKILPPLYHEKANTDRKTSSWQAGDAHLTSEEKELQKLLGTFLDYDSRGNLIHKITPDSGIVEYLYNSKSQMRFMVDLDDKTNQTNQIVYFNYDIRGQLTRNGHLSRSISIQDVKEFVESDLNPKAIDYQLVDFADLHPDPELRGRTKTFITYNQNKTNANEEDDIDEEIVEEIRFNSDEKIISKSLISMSGQNSTISEIGHLKKEYIDERLHVLEYPMTADGKKLRLVHQYDRLGQLVRITTLLNDKEAKFNFEYHATGQLASEEYQFSSSRRFDFKRTYKYNSPGFLERLSDPYLSEEIGYTSKGYGQDGFGDGIIMRTAFNASWSANVDQRWFQLNDEDDDNNKTWTDKHIATTCINALKRAGYLNWNGEPLKLFVKDNESKLPIVCSGSAGNRLLKRVAEKQRPLYYGHRYSYGNHQELVKAKYFTDEMEHLAKPLQADSFRNEASSRLNMTQSRHIWKLLIDANYILKDQDRTDPTAAIGKRGKSYLRDEELLADLGDLNKKYIFFIEPIKRLTISAIQEQKGLSLTDFESIFLSWEGVDHTSSRLEYNRQLEAAKTIGKMLFDKGYLPTSITNIARTLNVKFLETLSDYADILSDIVRVMSTHFAYGLGEHAFDVESFDIDANGNHKLFYTGSDRYQLNYKNNTNKIESVRLNSYQKGEKENEFAFKHDTQGNVVQAMHKGIEHIDYHSVTKRTTRIRLKDGRVLRFKYDAQGERVLKQVFNAKGELVCDTYYLRDEEGRVLFDMKTNYLPAPSKLTTSYIYGPRGLLGFIRNENFYSVTTDHAGSIRLVIKDGKVVAAYDYMPYGQLMRSFGDDPQAHIVYRFTGQEWDEETGLYNYHARLYDPSIGRFYQPDPKSQYFSPYKYAGNSPISLVDPDGEQAFTLIISLILGLIGAFFGGAAANGSLNPVKWDWKSSQTWLGIVGGGLTGAFLPGGFGSSVVVFSSIAAKTFLANYALQSGIAATVLLGLAGSYLTTAAINKDWNPANWNWKDINTYYGLFSGFATGTGLVSGPKSLKDFAKNIKNENLRKIFLVSSFAFGAGGAYFAASLANGLNFKFWEWDFKDPGTYLAFYYGFDTFVGMPQGFSEIGSSLRRVFKKDGLLSLSKLKETFQSFKSFKTVLKNPQHPFYKVTIAVLTSYILGSWANEDFSVWDFKNFSTYEGILNGIYFGKNYHILIDHVKGQKKTFKYKRIKESFKDKKQIFYKLEKLNESPLLFIRNFAISGFRGWEKDIKSKNSLELDDIKNSNTEFNVQSVPTNQKIKVDSATRFIIPNDQKVSSMFIKYDNETKSLEVYNYNSQSNSLDDFVYINQYGGDKIVNGGNNYINVNGENILEMPNGGVLVDRYEKPLVAKDGAISVLDKEIYFKFNNGSRPKQISTINSKPIEAIRNEKELNKRKEEKLAKEYDMVIKLDQYSKLSANNDLLINFKKRPPSHSTPILYRDNSSQWRFIAQNVIYNGNNKVKIDTSELDLALTPKIRIKKATNNDDFKCFNVTCCDDEINGKEIQEMEPKNVKQMVHSGSSRLKFWPLSLVKKAGQTVLSLLPPGWISLSSSNLVNYEKAQQSESFFKEPTVEDRKPHFSLLEMGDNFVKNIDLDGNLTWGILLARKWTGGFQQSTGKEESIDFDLWATRLVDEFKSTILSHALSCGIRSAVVKIVNESVMDVKVIGLVRHKLEIGQVNTIPEVLFEKMIRQQKNKIELASTKKQTDRLLGRICNDMPNSRKRFMQQEREFIMSKQCSTACCSLQASDEKCNINIGKHKTTGIESTENKRLSQI